MPGGTPAPRITGRTMPTSARAADRRGVWAWALAWSASGCRCKFVGTVGTNRKTTRNPLSPLEKSVPIGAGDKPFFRGDSGDKPLHARPGTFAPWVCLVSGAPESPHCSAKVAPAPRPLRAARQGSRPVIDQARKGRAGYDSTGSTQGPASGVCSRMGGPCRGSGTHVPTAHGTRPPGQSLGKPRP
jgi:hypothetical protein